MQTYTRPNPPLTPGQLQFKADNLKLWESTHGPYERWPYSRKELYHLELSTQLASLHRRGNCAG